MKYNYIAQIDAEETNEAELKEALTQSLTTINMPNGDTLFTNSVSIEPSNEEIVWIDASMKNPKEENQYWVHWSDGEIEIAHYLLPPFGSCFQRRCGTNEHHEGWNGNVGHVTHWQPSNKPTTKPNGEPHD